MGNNQSLQNRKRTKELKRLQTKRLMASELLVYHGQRDDADMQAPQKPVSTSHDSPFQRGALSMLSSPSHDHDRAPGQFSTEKLSRKQKARRSVPVGRKDFDSIVGRSSKRKTLYMGDQYMLHSASTWIFEQERKEAAEAEAAAAAEAEAEANAAAEAEAEAHAAAVAVAARMDHNKGEEQDLDGYNGGAPLVSMAGEHSWMTHGTQDGKGQSHEIRLSSDNDARQSHDLTPSSPPRAQSPDTASSPNVAPTLAPLPSAVFASFCASTSSFLFSRPDFRVSAQPRHESIDEVPELESRRSDDTMCGSRNESIVQSMSSTPVFLPMRSTSAPDKTRSRHDRNGTLTPPARPPLFRSMSDEDAESIGRLLAGSSFGRGVDRRRATRPISMLPTIPSRPRVSLGSAIGENVTATIASRQLHSEASETSFQSDSTRPFGADDHRGTREPSHEKACLTPIFSNPHSVADAQCYDTDQKRPERDDEIPQSAAALGASSFDKTRFDENFENGNNKDGEIDPLQVSGRVSTEIGSTTQQTPRTSVDVAADTMEQVVNDPKAPRPRLTAAAGTETVQEKKKSRKSRRESAGSTKGKETQFLTPEQKPTRRKSKNPRVNSSTQTTRMEEADEADKQAAPSVVSSTALEKRDSRKSTDASNKGLYTRIRTRIFDPPPAKTTIYVKEKGKRDRRIDNRSQVSLTASPTPSSCLSLPETEKSIKTPHPLRLVVTNRSRDDKLSAEEHVAETHSGFMNAGEFRKRRVKVHTEGVTVKNGLPSSSSSSSPRDSQRMSVLSSGYESDQTAVNGECVAKGQRVKIALPNGSGSLRNSSMPLLESAGAQEASLISDAAPTPPKTSHRPLPSFKALLGKRAEASTPPRFSSWNYRQSPLVTATSEIVAAETTVQVDEPVKETQTASAAKGSTAAVTTRERAASTSSAGDMGPSPDSFDSERRSRRRTAPSGSPAIVERLREEFLGVPASATTRHESLRKNFPAQMPQLGLKIDGSEWSNPLGASGSVVDTTSSQNPQGTANNSDRSRTHSLPPIRTVVTFGPRPLQTSQQRNARQVNLNCVAQPSPLVDKPKLVERGIQAGSTAQSAAVQYSSDSLNAEAPVSKTQMQDIDYTAETRGRAARAKSAEAGHFLATSRAKIGRSISPISSLHSTEKEVAAPFPESATQASLAALRALERANDSTSPGATRWAREKLLGSSTFGFFEDEVDVQPSATRTVSVPESFISNGSHKGMSQSHKRSRVLARANSLSSLDLSYRSGDDDETDIIESVGQTVSAQDSMLEILSIAAVADVMSKPEDEIRQLILSQRNKRRRSQAKASSKDDLSLQQPYAICKVPVSAADHLRKKALHNTATIAAKEDTSRFHHRSAGVTRISEEESGDSDDTQQQIMTTRPSEVRGIKMGRQIAAAGISAQESCDPPQSPCPNDENQKHTSVSLADKRTRAVRSTRRGYTMGDIQQWQESLCQASLEEASSNQLSRAA